MVGSVTDATFDSEIKNATTPVVIDFWAEWCGPCRQMLPILEEVDQELKGQVKILKMNVDENSRIPSQFNIRSIPTLIIFKDGELVDQQVGAVPKSKLVSLIKAA